MWKAYFLRAQAASMQKIIVLESSLVFEDLDATQLSHAKRVPSGLLFFIPDLLLLLHLKQHKLQIINTEALIMKRSFTTCKRLIIRGHLQIPL